MTVGPTNKELSLVVDGSHYCTSSACPRGDFGIAAGVGVAASQTVMLTLLGLVCLTTNSVILPDGYPAKTA